MRLPLWVPYFKSLFQRSLFQRSLFQRSLFQAPIYSPTPLAPALTLPHFSPLFLRAPHHSLLFLYLFVCCALSPFARILAPLYMRPPIPMGPNTLRSLHLRSSSLWTPHPSPRLVISMIVVLYPVDPTHTRILSPSHLRPLFVWVPHFYVSIF